MFLPLLIISGRALIVQAIHFDLLGPDISVNPPPLPSEGPKHPGNTYHSAHSAFAPTARTTLPKRSVSDAMNAANSVGVVVTTSAPWSVICLTTFGSRIACTNAELSLPMTASGVPAGATRPNQTSSAIPAKPASVIVGASGSTGRRCGDVTAMARTLPPCRNGSNDE